jgi:hypothetical protein
MKHGREGMNVIVAFSTSFFAANISQKKAAGKIAHGFQSSNLLTSADDTSQ